MEPKHFESLYPENSREKEIKQILTCIKSGNFNQTMSLPGGGRSNLLGLLSYNKNIRTKHLGEKEKLFHFVLCNFSEVRNRPLADAFRLLSLSLIDSLASRHAGRVQHLQRILDSPRQRRGSQNDYYLSPEATTLKQIFNESVNSKDDALLFHSLKKAIEYLTLEKNMTIVFLFDNFDEYLPMVSPDFFKDLKILRNTAIYKFSTVFALNRPLETVLDQQVIADIYQFIADHKVYLSLYDKPSLEFRINSIEKALNKTIKKENLQKIIALTGGHINLTRLCVETILESSYPHPNPLPKGEGGGEGGPNLSEFLLRHKSIQGALLDIWNSLTPAEQNLLTTSNQQPRHSGEERQRRLQNPSLGDSGQARMTASYLKNIGLLKNGEITIKLLEYFLKQNPSLQSREQKIVFDALTKEIKKGNLLISDKLTSFEYNLLRFLLENPNRVVQRSEIINAVWKEEKSVLGVTDQALDQLVFRVRRKTENDPNNPTHLLTVKGRGFRFNP